MKKPPPFIQAFHELPNSLPIFPLSHAVLLPNGHLPLTIFEPRYLNMVQDAMKSNQLIGMVQPRDNNTLPTLHDIGCVGRIIRYEEMFNGRLAISLKGICRFNIKNELAALRGYRVVIPDWSPFAHDYHEQENPDTQTTALFNSALQCYCDHANIQVDWPVLEQLSLEDLSNSMISHLPIRCEDKQLLMQADNLADRIVVFTAILKSSINEQTTQH